MKDMHAKKSLGQNFLQDDAVIQNILLYAALKGEDTVLEIGPGQGALTRPLLAQVKKVIAIEADPRFQALFREEDSRKLAWYEGNILDINLETIIVNEVEAEYSVIANIPYYITAPIIRLLLAQKKMPKQIILMVQNEVAERLVAAPGSTSLLSIMAQYYAETEKLFFVPREAFVPQPNVDSAVVRLIPKRSFDEKKDRDFFRVVKAGFQARRKTLANNISSLFPLNKTECENLFESMSLRKDIRAQALSIQEWQELTSALLEIENNKSREE